MQVKTTYVVKYNDLTTVMFETFTGRYYISVGSFLIHKTQEEAEEILTAK